MTHIVSANEKPASISDKIGCFIFAVFIIIAGLVCFYIGSLPFRAEALRDNLRLEYMTEGDDNDNEPVEVCGRNNLKP